jgi:fructokinase
MHQDKACIVLDPNVRPALIADRNDYLRKIKRWIGLADIVKVSTQDLAWLEPELSYAALAKAWLELGPSIVIITDGENGAILHRKSKDPMHVPAPKVKVVDTVGAGDTFTGSLMVALLKRKLNQHLAAVAEEVWLEILRFAVAAAAYNCTRAGANPPTSKELSTFVKEIS